MSRKWIFLFFLIGACQRDEEPLLVNSIKDYFPLEVGQFKIYSFAETEYIFGSDPVQRNYEIKEEVVDKFITAEIGDSIAVIYRYRRQDASSDWIFDQTVQVRISQQTVVIFEGNTPYIKLSSPMSVGHSWDGNFANAYDIDNYFYDSLNVSRQTMAGQFDRTITVVQSNIKDVIVNTDVRFEHYAEGLGLIDVQVNLINYCTDNNCLGQQIIESGIVYRGGLVAYGSN